MVGQWLCDAFTNCPDGWVPYQESCYWIRHDKPLTFDAAKQHCDHESGGMGKMLYVSSADENAWIKDYLRDMRVGTTYWWLGLTDKHTEGSWHWVASQQQTTFTDFKPGDLGDHNQEDCAIYASVHNFQWADVACSINAYPICKINYNDLELFGK
ncbi:perlucin-like protein [Mya arenaria]|uniref:perlucin-like protein n=1 Tax=Mya arenaria TaxID=6604 RepID=UPI0022E39C4C|nr:perlucin-like protein [Mya arenaria]